MTALRKIDEVKLRDNRARKILATARLNLVGHIDRDDRVAVALATARANIVRFTPPHEQRLLREAAVARQARVKRILGAARDTLRRTAHIKPPSHNSEIVRKITTHARVAPGAPSPTPRRQTEALPPLADGIDDLRHRFEVMREAVPEAMGQLVADLRNELQRENDLLRRELDVTHRELDSLRRTLAGSRA